MENKFIVDSHSHIGKDIFHGESKIDEYIDFATKSGINVGVLMGVPSPCKELSNVNSRLMYWRYVNNIISYFGPKNPFEEMNYELCNLINAKSSKDLLLLFAAVFHPILDDIYYFEKLIKDTTPVAIKIHGIGSGVGPKDISQDYIDFLKLINIPLIVHTDCDFGLSSQSMQYVRNINRAIEWARFFNENGIKGILNHGASLDKTTFDIVNTSEYLKVAIGPDKVACIDNNRLFVDCMSNYVNYLKYIRENLHWSKIIYDADFNWNVTNPNSLDYDSVLRIKEIFGDFESSKILGDNLLDFNPLILKRVKEE